MTIKHCGVYDSHVAIRAEDNIRDLRIQRLGIGPNVRRTLVRASGGVGPGYETVDEFQPPPIEQALKNGFLTRDK